jgi:hypothetical protein
MHPLALWNGAELLMTAAEIDAHCSKVGVGSDV